MAGEAVKPTLEEVARSAGVSRSTVSRVINEEMNVSDETRARVWRAVEQLGYRPNAAARSLASRHSQIISIVIPQAANTVFAEPFFTRLFQGIHDRATELGYHIMLSIRSREDGDLNELHLNATRGQLLDGLIVTSARIDDPVLERLLAMELPFVTIGRDPVHPQVSTVDADNVGGASAAVSHLIRMGRQRIATITGPQTVIPGVDRLTGCRLALKKHDLPFDKALIAPGEFTRAGGYQAMQTLLKEKPDAVFVASDLMAYGAMAALAQAGVRIPEDIAIVGFDDFDASAHTYPPLTTVRQPVYELGTLAAATLIDWIEGRSASPQHHTLPTELVIRRSCGFKSTQEEKH